MQKRNSARLFLFNSLLLVIICFLVNSCRKGDTTNPAPTDYQSITIENAKNYFVGDVVANEKKVLNASYSTLSISSDIQRFARMQKLNNVLDWDNAKYYKVDGKDFISVIVNQANKPFKNQHFSAFRSLIFFRDSLGQTTVSIIEFISNKMDENINGDFQNISKLAFSNIFLHKTQSIAKLNISVLLYNSDYTMQNSFSINNGIWGKSNSLLKTNSSPPPIFRTPASANTNVPTQTCTQYDLVYTEYDADGNEIFSQILDSWVECDGDEDGGLVDIPYGEPPSNTSKADHKLPHPKTLPTNGTTNTQFGAMCTFKTLEWISAYFGGTVTAFDAVQWLASEMQITFSDMLAIITTNGITYNQLLATALHYFDCNGLSSNCDISSIKSSIDAGYPLFASMLNPGSTTDGHEVMVTGYNNDGTIEYFDPLLGIYINTAFSNLFNFIQVKKLS